MFIEHIESNINDKVQTTFVRISSCKAKLLLIWNDFYGIKIDALQMCASFGFYKNPSRKTNKKNNIGNGCLAAIF